MGCCIRDQRAKDLLWVIQKDSSKKKLQKSINSLKIMYLI